MILRRGSDERQVQQGVIRLRTTARHQETTSELKYVFSTAGQTGDHAAEIISQRNQFFDDDISLQKPEATILLIKTEIRLSPLEVLADRDSSINTPEPTLYRQTA